MGQMELADGSPFEFEGTTPSKNAIEAYRRLNRQIKETGNVVPLDRRENPEPRLDGISRLTGRASRLPIGSPEGWKQLQTDAVYAANDLAGNFFQGIGDTAVTLAASGDLAVSKLMRLFGLKDGESVSLPNGMEYTVRPESQINADWAAQREEAYNQFGIPLQRPDEFDETLSGNLGLAVPFVSGLKLPVAGRKGAQALQEFSRRRFAQNNPKGVRVQANKNRTFNVTRPPNAPRAAAQTPAQIAEQASVSPSPSILRRIKALPSDVSDQTVGAMGEMNSRLLRRPMGEGLEEFSSEVAATGGGLAATTVFPDSPTARFIAEMTAGGLGSTPTPLVKTTEAAGRALNPRRRWRDFLEDWSMVKEEQGAASKAVRGAGAVVSNVPMVRAARNAVQRRQVDSRTEAGQELYETLPEETRSFIMKQAEEGGDIVGQGNPFVDLLYRYLSKQIDEANNNTELGPFISRKLQANLNEAANDLRKAGSAQDLETFARDFSGYMRKMLDNLIDQAQSNAAAQRTKAEEMNGPEPYDGAKLSAALYEGLLEARTKAREQEGILYEQVGPQTLVNAEPLLRSLISAREGKLREGASRTPDGERANYRTLKGQIDRSKTVVGAANRLEVYEFAKKLRQKGEEWPGIAEQVNQKFGGLAVVNRDGSISTPIGVNADRIRKFSQKPPDLRLPLAYLREFQIRMRENGDVSELAPTSEQQAAGLARELQAATDRTFKNATEEDVGITMGPSSLTPEKQQLLRMARDYTIEVSNAFGRSPISQLFGRSSRGDPNIDGVDFLARNLGNSDSTANLRTLNAVNAAMKVARANDSFRDPSSQILQSFLRGRFLQRLEAALPGDGSDPTIPVDPKIADQFIREYQDVLQFFPDVEGEIRAVKQAGDAANLLNEQGKTLDEASRNPADPKGYGVLQYYAGNPSSNIFDTVFDAAGADPKRSNPVQRMAQLLENIRVGPRDENGKPVRDASLPGRNAVLDSLKYEFRTYIGKMAGMPIDVGQNSVPSGAPGSVPAARALDFVRNPNNRQVLLQLFDQSELEDIEKSLTIFRDSAMVKNAEPDQFPKQITDAEKADFANDIIGIYGAKLGAAAQRFLPGPGGVGAGFSAANRGSRIAERLSTVLAQGQKKRVMADAMKDPRLMADLIRLGEANSPYSPTNDKTMVENMADPFRRLPYLRGYIATSFGNRINQEEEPVEGVSENRMRRNLMGQ